MYLVTNDSAPLISCDAHLCHELTENKGFPDQALAVVRMTTPPQRCLSPLRVGVEPNSQRFVHPLRVNVDSKCVRCFRPTHGTAHAQLTGHVRRYHLGSLRRWCASDHGAKRKTIDNLPSAPISAHRSNEPVEFNAGKHNAFGASAGEGEARQRELESCVSPRRSHSPQRVTRANMILGVKRGADFWHFLYSIDQDLAKQTREVGCSCGGRLHCANYPRKPRGGPDWLPEEYELRFSFCCDRDGCRRRTTPASVRYLGREVYLHAVIILLTAMQQGATPRRVHGLSALLGIVRDRSTLARWRVFWQEQFPETHFWRVARARLVPVYDIVAYPLSIVEAFLGHRSWIAKSGCVDLMRRASSPRTDRGRKSDHQRWPNATLNRRSDSLSNASCLMASRS